MPCCSPVVIKVSGLACAGRRDRPVEGNSGQEGVQIQQPLHGETPRGAGEPTCPPSDGRGFLTEENARVLQRWTEFPGNVSDQRVAVGRCELIGPGQGPGEGVHDVRNFYREPTQVGGVTRPLCKQGHERGDQWRAAGNNPFQAAFEGHLLAPESGDFAGNAVLVAFPTEAVRDGPVGEMG